VHCAAQIIQAVSDTFGKSIWKKTVLVLTHGNLVQPPPGSDYGKGCVSITKCIQTYNIHIHIHMHTRTHTHTHTHTHTLPASLHGIDPSNFGGPTF